MPRLPTVGFDAGQSERFDAPRTAPRQDFTADQLGDLSQGLQAASRGALEVGRDISRAKVRHRLNLLGEQIVLAKRDLEGKAGKDAVDAFEPTLARIKEQQKKLGEDLSQGEQAVYGEQSFADVVFAEDALRAHRDRSEKAWEIGEADAGRVLKAQAYGEYWQQDPEAAAAKKADAVQDAERVAKLRGWGPEQTRAFVLETTSGMHAGAIGQLIAAKRAGDARAYLDASKGEMTPEAFDKLSDEVDRNLKVARDQARDTLAWDYATRLSGSGATLMEQKAAIDESVRTKGMTTDVALKAWSLVKDIADQKWQEAQRERTSTKQQLEQAFAANPKLSVDGLSAEVLDQIDRLGMRGEAFKIHRDVRENRIADALADGSMTSLQLSRDVRSMGELARLIERLGERRPYGDEAKTPQGMEKSKRLDEQIALYEQWIEAIASRPRTFQIHDDVPLPALPEGEEPPPFDVREFSEQIKKALYPGSGR